MSNSQTYYIYILRCSDRSLYVGYTTNLKNRLFWHYKGFASQYTAQRRPVTLVYSEAYVALPQQVKDIVSTRISDVLLGNDRSADFDHLTEQDRRAITEILNATSSIKVDLN